MSSNTTMQMDHNESRLVETKVVDINSTRPLTRLHHQRGDLWNDESSSHPEKTSSMCEDQLPLPPKSVNSKNPIIKASPTNQIKSFGRKERTIGDLVVQDTRYIALNNHVHKKPSSASHLDMLSPSTDIGNTRALAGLIVMCNDRVRRSFFKHGVFGVPLRKKPILDRVDANTLIFLFEFEARALWGIYKASSEVSVDIEKDAYRGSETAFPAQVKFRILEKCRPLPEKLFKLAIADNYYTPTKFHFELTEAQVTYLTRLYYVRDAEKLRLNNRALYTEEPATLYETASKEGCLEGAVYQVGTNGRNTPNTRDQTTFRPQCKELLVRGGDDPEANTSVSDRNLTNDPEYDHPRYLFWHPKDLPNLRTHKDHPHAWKNQALEYSIDDEQNHRYGGARVGTTLLEPRTTSLNCYPHLEEEILSEDDLRRQLCQAKLFHYAGTPIYKSCAEDCIRSPPESFPDAAVDSNARAEQSFDEEYYLRMLKLGQLNHSRLLPLRSDQPEVSACQRLHRGNSACDVALWNLQLHSKKSLKPCSTMHTPAKHHMELTPDLQEWQMHEPPQDAENAYTMETLTKRHLISSGDAYAQTHDYSVEGFPTRGKACAQSHDYSVDGGGKASASIRRRAPPEEEVWRDNLCRKGLMTLRSKSVQEVEVENNMCSAKCCISKQETDFSDDEHWLESILCKVKDRMPKRHEVGDGGAWVGDNGHVSVSTSSIMSKSCNNVPNQEQDIQVDQNGVSELHSRRQKSSVCASDAHNGVEGVQPPRKSVWSRLSASRNWLDCRQMSIPNEDMQSELNNNLLYSEALPWKRKVDTIDYEVDERSSPDEDCSEFVEDGVNVHFKRRKLGNSRKAEPYASSTSQEQGGTVGVNDSSIPIDRTHCNNPIERRKIRRPL